MDFPAITAAAALALDADHQVLDVLAFGDLLFSCVSGDHRVYFRPNVELYLDVTCAGTSRRGRSREPKKGGSNRATEREPTGADQSARRPTGTVGKPRPETDSLLAPRGPSAIQQPSVQTARATSKPRTTA